AERATAESARRWPVRVARLLPRGRRTPLEGATMADDMTPGEASVNRDGPQLNLHEARSVADRAGTVRGEAGQRVADRDVTESPVREHLSSASRPAARGAGGGTGNARADERSPDEAPFTDSETALGGADAVQKTSYGVGHGTEPTGLEEH